MLKTECVQSSSTSRKEPQLVAHAEQYFDPPGNHPSQPNYLWLEAGTNFGVLADTQPGQPQLSTDQHLVKLLENAGISWRAYAEPDFGSPMFDTCPIDFTYLNVEHLVSKSLRFFLKKMLRPPCPENIAASNEASPRDR